jgi:hypothetical protein
MRGNSAIVQFGLLAGPLLSMLDSSIVNVAIVPVAVIAGFMVLALASLGILAIGAGTALWVIATILAVRSVSIGLVINPLLQALTAPLPRQRMADASTLFNAAQRVAGSFGIGLIAALYADLARSSGPVGALHTTGLVITGIAAAGGLLAFALPTMKNVAGFGR